MALTREDIEMLQGYVRIPRDWREGPQLVVAAERARAERDAIFQGRPTPIDSRPVRQR